METGSLERVGQLAKALRAQPERRATGAASARPASQATPTENDGIRLSISAKGQSRGETARSNEATPESRSAPLESAAPLSQSRRAFKAYLGSASAPEVESMKRAAEEKTNQRGTLFRARV